MWGTLKATLVSVLFGLILTLGWIQTGSADTLPLLGYYVVLIVNTFFSVQAFTPITPKNTLQMIFDVALVVIYALLAFSFGSTLSFSILLIALFGMTITKYVHLNRVLPTHHVLLHRKVRINVLGLMLSAVAFAVAAYGFPYTAAWVLFGVFAVANFYLLAIKPMYRLST